MTETMLDVIDEKVALEEALTQKERDSLIDGIFKTKLKDDDPKYDDSNYRWLNGMLDSCLLRMYNEYK